MSQTEVPSTSDSDQSPLDSDELVAEPDVGYRWKHLILAILAIALGGWFAYDGWVNWPRQNQMAAKLERDLEIAQRNTSSSGDAEKQRLATELRKYEKHNDASILLQKILATVLPAFGIFWGVWTIKDTRGRYRLSSNMLHVPGHPPVTLNDIRRIDKRKWDRKGIAYLHYEHGSPPTQHVLKLDDFAYEREPTDEILQQIEKNLLTTGPAQRGFPVV